MPTNHNFILFFLLGGWLLISRFLMKTVNSLQDSIVMSSSYKAILPKYNSNNQYLLRNGFNQLKQDMGFTQIRFYCFKNKTGRVLHIMTNTDSKGANVVKFFTNSNTAPRACNSFSRLPDDTSILALICDKWGYPTADRWGNLAIRTDDRLYKRPFVRPFTRYFRFEPGSVYDCDDTPPSQNMSVGDIWQIFVR